MKVKNLIPFYYEPDRNEHFVKRLAKSGIHALYSIVVLGGLVVYGIGVLDTGKFNPIMQDRIYQERIEKRNSEEKLYDEKWEKIFGKNGYADENKNGIVSISEGISALDRMIIDPTYKFMRCSKRSTSVIVNRDYEISCDIGFSPTLKDLEQVIKSYEKER